MGHMRALNNSQTSDDEKLEKERQDKYPFGRFDKVFVKVPDVKVNDIDNWSRTPRVEKPWYLQTDSDINDEYEEQRRRQRRPKPTISTESMAGSRNDKGVLVSFNGHLIALHRIEGKVYAINDSCPHAGGPLSLGDIEEIPGFGLCVICPWHQWRVQLEDGLVRQPMHACLKNTKGVVYPTHTNSRGDIYIAFDQLSPEFFNLDLHPRVDPPTPVNKKPAKESWKGELNHEYLNCENKEVWVGEIPPYPSMVYMY